MSVMPTSKKVAAAISKRPAFFRCGEISSVPSSKIWAAGAVVLDILPKETIEMEAVKMIKQFAARVLGLCSLMPVLILLGCAATPLQATNPSLPNIGTGLTAPLILQPKLLDAAVAFKFAARLKDSKTIEVRFQIAPGYYMYKDQFQASVQVTSQLNLTALAPILPVGNIVDDPGFGKVETYRQVVFFDVPLSEPVALYKNWFPCVDARLPIVNDCAIGSRFGCRVL